jgi:hypothetical protein
MTLQTNVMSYAGSGKTISVPNPTKPSSSASPNRQENVGSTTSTAPDFTKMTSDERLAFHRNRLKNL